MSQKNSLIIGLQDLTTLENSLVIWMYFIVIMALVLFVSAFITRKELQKTLTSGFYAPKSKVPKFLRYLMHGLLILATILVITGGFVFSKIKDVRAQMQNQALVLENQTRDETQMIMDQELKNMAPITQEEFSQIDKEVREDIAQGKKLLEAEAKKRADLDPSTTIEIELHKLMNELKMDIEKAQGLESKPMERDPNKTSEENMNDVINAMFNEPIKQVQHEQKTKSDSFVSEQ